VLAHTYIDYGTTSFEGYIELKQGLSQDAFKEALLRCVGGDVRAALRRITVTGVTPSSDDAAGLRRVLSPVRYNGETYFMHGSLCSAVARSPVADWHLVWRRQRAGGAHADARPCSGGCGACQMLRLINNAKPPR
jgi:hypothetical protein